jgi:hypothetical protein
MVVGQSASRFRPALEGNRGNTTPVVLLTGGCDLLQGHNLSAAVLAARLLLGLVVAVYIAVQSSIRRPDAAWLIWQVADMHHVKCQNAQRPCVENPNTSRYTHEAAT